MFYKIILIISLTISYTLYAQDFAIPPHNEGNGNSVYVARYKGDKQCAVTYTFDDGLFDQYTHAFPEFEKRGLKATFFITPLKVETSGRCTWMRLKEMAEHGHEISNHGWAHKNITTLTMNELKAEVDKGDSAITANIGKHPTTYAYPGNRKFTGETMTESQKNIMSYVNHNRVGTRMAQISWGMKNKENMHKNLAKTINNGDWLVTMTHGLITGYDAFIDPTPFWQHLDEVKAMEDKVWVGTFAEVAAYIAEREAVKISVMKTKKGFKITPTCNLDQKIYKEKLTLVVISANGEKKLVDFDPFGKAFTINIK